MIRLVLIIILLLVGLLTIFPAPVMFLWYVAIIVTEFSWIFILLLVLLISVGFGLSTYQLTGSVLGIIAIGLYLVPIVGAYNLSKRLPQELNVAFDHDNNTNKSAFSLKKILYSRASKIQFTTIRYKPQYDLSLDYYPAQQDGIKPCIIVIHGGSWKGGNSKQLPELNSYLASKGYNVASVNYRLAPMHNSPAQYEDVKDAMAYLCKHADEFRIDTHNLILLGRSAGAQIALLAAYKSERKGIRGVISYYGPADMVWGYMNPAKIYNSCDVLKDYIGGTYEQMSAAYESSSPIEAIDSNDVPTLLIHGKNDVLVAYGHSTRLVQKLARLGIKHYLLTLPWATHGCDYTLNGPSGQLATYAVERFLDNVVDTAYTEE